MVAIADMEHFRVSIDPSNVFAALFNVGIACGTGASHRIVYRGFGVSTMENRFSISSSTLGSDRVVLAVAHNCCRFTYAAWAVARRTGTDGIFGALSVQLNVILGPL